MTIEEYVVKELQASKEEIQYLKKEIEYRGKEINYLKGIVEIISNAMEYKEYNGSKWCTFTIYGNDEGFGKIKALLKEDKNE